MARIIDYTPGVFTHYYVEDGERYCFTVYPDFYVRNQEMKDLCLSLHDRVVGICPEGAYSFKIYFRDGKFEVSKKVKIKKDLLELIINSIREWSKTHKVITEYDGDRIIA